MQHATTTKRFPIALAVFTVMLLPGCSDKSPSEPGGASLTVAPKAATLAVGGKVQLTATIRDANGSVVEGRTVTWSSGNTAVSTVDAHGLVTAVATGSAEITASSQGTSDRAGISVITIAQVSQSLSAGGLGTCRLTLNGTAYCWGNGPIGSTSSTVPVAVSGGLTFSTLTVGNFSICGIAKTETAYCWGEYGGSVPAVVPGGHGFIALTIGDGFGAGHYCGLTASGSVFCWGNNTYGQVGDGTTSGDVINNGWFVRTAPVAVAGGISFAAVRAGVEHTCGLTTAGLAYCWGDNGSSQLGGGSSAPNSSVPVPVVGGRTFASLSAGGNDACGLTSSGAAYCWGANGAGALGNGSTTASSVPVAVSGGISFSAITTSGGHACGLTADGTAYCWGWNAVGELGIGNNAGPEQCPNIGGACSTKPVAVAGGLKFAALSAGGQTTCGVTLSDTTYCWGDNRYGQLGNGTKINASEPVQVVGLDAPSTVASVALSPDAAAIVPGATVQLSATTRDANGSLLLGRSISWSSADPAVATVDVNGLVTGVGSGSATVTGTSEGKSATASITVATITFSSLSVGGSHTCGLTSNGSAYCWGSGYGGPVAVGGGFSFSALTAGQDHTCGLTASGAAYCWGANANGELGNGSALSSATPVAVTGHISFSALTAGGSHTCGLSTSGSAYCWGANFNGQLGDASTTSSATPVAVAGGLSFVTVVAGGFHSCGLTAAGVTYCWGRNEEGQLSLGTTSGPESCGNIPVACSTAPGPVIGGIQFSEVETSGWHTCALSIGAAYCWGVNDRGQLGNGSAVNSAQPIPVSGNQVFSALSTGQSRGHSCGLTTSGAAFCWGGNATGQLGNGSTTGSPVPVAVSGGLTWSSIVTGSPLNVTSAGHSCAMTTSGVAYCWGDNSAGQLGDGTRMNRPAPVPVAGQR